MANICSNKFYFTCNSPSLTKYVEEKFKTLFENDLNGEIWYCEDEVIEGDFESRWSFPEHIFEHFFDEFGDDSIYFRCLSEEYGCELVSMNIYSDGMWKEPQYFDL